MKKLYTSQGEEILNKNTIPHSEYPRPTLVRDSYINLNGYWEFAACTNNEIPIFDKEILVPFAPESILSGIDKHYPDGTELHYKRTFDIPTDFINNKVLLHIGAVDQCASVYINGNEVGYHVGGYSSFCLDITSFIKVGINDICIRATDNLNSSILPYGKQKEKRGGMWYTPISGIWQTVWLESVPEEYISSIEFVTDKSNVTITLNDELDALAYIDTNDGEIEVKISKGQGTINITSPIFWCPENPYLYNVTVKTKYDTVKSYFAFRTLEINESGGIKRLCLNGKPFFFHGLLDQGYWSDGIYTPASDQCFIDDIMTAKKLGFNTLRKHIKTEPERFYYHCDRLGIIVFQDMINNGDYSFFRDTALPTLFMKKLNDKKLHKTPAIRKAFTECTENIIKTLKKHPCICLWTIFNEGWGQFEGNIMYDFVKTLDETRFIDTASGWFKCEKTDVESIHTYFKKYKHIKASKPVILSEFGGYAYKIKGNSFNEKKTYGYKKFKTEKDFGEAVENLYYNEIIPAIKSGLCCDIYTQLSDVEDETNGFITYDRKHLKISEEMMKNISQKISEEVNSEEVNSEEVNI
ncbi:MAG: glycoside hydrolase family 2 [Ruminococcaceae bacterium]|nr:glycoside hydrolase family 2 [Oscillospiraceae bacterium]